MNINSGNVFEVLDELREDGFYDSEVLDALISSIGAFVLVEHVEYICRMFDYVPVSATEDGDE